MTNQIRTIQIRQQLRDLSEPELWISVEPEQHVEGLELRGRLVGPRCVFATTVEVAYPLRPFSRQPEGLPELSRRVVIPEASYWDPQSPFLYEGTIELWHKDECCARQSVRVGLKVTTASQRGFRLNGHLLEVTGCCTDPTLEEAGRLRQQGVNVFITPVTDNNADLWDLADRIGVLLVGRAEGETLPIAAMQARGTQPSCLGWIVPLERIADLNAAGASGYRGIELHEAPEQALPAGVQFVLAPERLLPALEALALPKLFVKHDEAGGNGHSDASRLGWVKS